MQASDDTPIDPANPGDTPTRRVDPDDSPAVRGLSPERRVFGRYVLKSLAGRGGMGVVWVARDERLKRLVALKLLPEVVAEDPEAVRDLLRETNRCLELTHPNIVRVHDLVQDGPLAAISMEYVDGESLAKRKAAAPGGCLTLAELRPLMGQLCAALEHAHRVGKVVHRDLKPANLLLTKDGQLKVTDFGIARSLSDTHTRLTGRVGNTSGTLLYMSPQQLLGEDPAASDDIYALGATLYELLTGKPPFHTGDVATQIRAVMPKPVNARLAALGRDPVPAEWEETIQACLAKEPENRPKSAAEVARRLNLTAEGQEQVRRNQTGSDQTGGTADHADGADEKDAGAARATPPPQNSKRKRRSLLVAGLAALALAAVSWWFFGSYLPAQRKLEEELAALRLAALEKLRGAEKEGQAWTVPDLNLEMAYVRSGTFTMGGCENFFNDEKPLTRVTLTKGYWLGKTEVTQGQYEALMGSNPSDFKNAGRDAPVEQVSWDDAMQFCRKLTERERSAGRLPWGYDYTLPTEAQWEYACRAGTTGAYAGNLDSMGWYTSNSGNTTHPVAQKQANAWGLYDMHGNVWEWCRDWYGDYPGGSVTDPTGPSSGTFRVIRGGSWNFDAGICRSASRLRYDPGNRLNDLGFRLSLAPQVSR